MALIDRCNALIYYLDDEMVYSREMLLSDTPEFIKELEKQKKFAEQNRNRDPKIVPKKKGFWDGIKKLFK